MQKRKPSYIVDTPMTAEAQFASAVFCCIEGVLFQLLLYMLYVLTIVFYD